MVMRNKTVNWHGNGRERATEEPDPNAPRGIYLDISAGRTNNCLVPLEYPAPGPGIFLVRCAECGGSWVITCAGRVDDPRSVRVACRDIVVGLRH